MTTLGSLLQDFPPDIRNSLLYVRQRLLTDEVLRTNIRGALLLGSYATGDFLPNMSDLDIFFLCRSSSIGKVTMSTLEHLQNMTGELKEYASTPISLLPHTVHDLRGYVDVEYLYYYAQGVPLEKRDARTISIIKHIREQKDIRLSTIRKLMVYNLEHRRFNINRKFSSFVAPLDTLDLKSHVKTFIDDYLESCQWALHTQNIWPGNKSAICSEIRQHFPHLSLPLLDSLSHGRGRALNNSRKNLIQVLRESVFETNTIANHIIDLYG